LRIVTALCVTLRARVSGAATLARTGVSVVRATTDVAVGRATTVSPRTMSVRLFSSRATVASGVRSTATTRSSTTRVRLMA
jgi:hypothetical protein